MAHIDRRAFVAGAAAVTATLFTQASALAQAAPVTIPAASSAVDDVAPVLWGIHIGAVAKPRLYVSLPRMHSGSAVTAAVISGAREVGKSSMLPLLAAHSHNLPIS